MVAVVVYVIKQLFYSLSSYMSDMSSYTTRVRRITINCFPAMSSTSLFGVLGEFDPSTELFIYLSAELLAAAGKKKVAVFIFVMGKNSYVIVLRDLCSPDPLKDKSFSQLCDKLKDHYKSKRLEVAEKRTDFIEVFRKKMRVFLLIAFGCDVMLPLAIFDEFLNRSLRD